jgi:glycosyltransferase involved in cell wall biosynthesis
MERDEIAGRAVRKPSGLDATHCKAPWSLSVAQPSRSPRVSVVIAALNEQDCLEHVLPLIPEGVFEVILADGHSTDGTVETARRLRPDIRVVYQPGRGKGDALRCAFAAARGDIIISLDADGSTDPREIPTFVDALVDGADYVKGTRFAHGGGTSDMTLTRKTGNWGFVVLARVLFGSRYTDFCYGYFGFWRSLLPILALESDGFEIECEVNCRAAMTKLTIVEVPSFESDRVAGEAHLRPFQDGWRILMEMTRQWRSGLGRVGRKDRLHSIHLLPEVDAVRLMEGQFSAE